MPVQSIWMIRFSLLSLLVAVFIGALLLIHKTIEIHPAMWFLLPLHYELAIWGWLVQFVMGTAYWIFPRHLTGEARGPDSAAWCMVLLFNAGLFLLVTAHLQHALIYIKSGGRFLLLLSLLLFVRLMWKRVATYRKE